MLLLTDSPYAFKFQVQLSSLQFFLHTHFKYRKEIKIHSVRTNKQT